MDLKEAMKVSLDKNRDWPGIDERVESIMTDELKAMFEYMWTIRCYNIHQARDGKTVQYFLYDHVWNTIAYQTFIIWLS